MTARGDTQRPADGRLLGLALSVLLAVVHVRAGQAQHRKSVVRGKDGTVYDLTVSPAPEPDEALSYSFVPGFGEQVPGNAAQIYHTAAEILHGNATESLADKAAEWLGMPVEDVPRDKVYSALAGALHYVDLAVHRERCEWDLPIRSEGFSLQLPMLARFRSLGRALAVTARVQTADGRLDEAFRTLGNGLLFARHVSQGDTLIHALVGNAIASVMLHEVAELLQAPDAPNLYWALTSLPTPFIDPRRAMAAEMDILPIVMPELKDLEQKRLSREEVDAVLEKLDGVAGLAGGPRHGLGRDVQRLYFALRAYPDAKRNLVQRGTPAATVEAMPVAQVVLVDYLEEFRRLRDNGVKWLYVPYHQAHQGLRRAESKLGRSRTRLNPLLAVLPAWQAAYVRFVSLERDINALRCVEALRMHAAAHDNTLPTTLNEVTAAPIPDDPFWGKPFAYEISDEGAAIVSRAPKGVSKNTNLRCRIRLRK